MTATIKPPPLRPAVPGGFDLDDFEIDEEAGTVTCPAGIEVALSAKRRARIGAHARLALWPPSARQPRLVGSSCCTRITAILSPPGPRPAPKSSPRSTGGGGRWWSAAWPG